MSIAYPPPTEPKFNTAAVTQTNAAFGGVAFTVTSNSTVNKSHCITAFYEPENPAGEGGVALNAVSNNTKNSCVFVSGVNTDHATIKLTHTNKSGSEGGDNAAACLNLNMVKGAEGGTTCQGLRIGSEDEVPNAKGPYITAVRGTGGSLVNLFRLLASGVFEMFEAEGAEPKLATTKPETGKVKFFFFNKKLFCWLSVDAEPKEIVIP